MFEVLSFWSPLKLIRPSRSATTFYFAYYIGPSLPSICFSIRNRNWYDVCASRARTHERDSSISFGSKWTHIRRLPTAASTSYAFKFMCCDVRHFNNGRIYLLFQCGTRHTTPFMESNEMSLCTHSATRRNVHDTRQTTHKRTTILSDARP